MRHHLGEYYTPDWLAEMVLDEAGYDGDPRKRLLDPACGSGTFLVLAIQRARQYAARHGEPPRETAKRILANIWGFDLNPLAVIAARTNYLFALGDLINQVESPEIPVYLADSVLWPQRAGQMDLAAGDCVSVPTAVETFRVPAIWVKHNGFLMRRAAPLVESMAKQRYSANAALKRLKREGLVFPPHEEVVKSFYRQVLALEKEKKNGIWARFLKNAFAPMVADKFDYVVGNPPWIRWGYLAQAYREATLPLWTGYGLFSLKGAAARLGGGEKDFSMLFAYAAIDFYVAPRGNSPSSSPKRSSSPRVPARASAASASATVPLFGSPRLTTWSPSTHSRAWPTRLLSSSPGKARPRATPSPIPSGPARRASAAFRPTHP